MALIPKLALAGDGSPSPRKDPAAVSKKITFLASEIDTESFSSNFSMSAPSRTIPLLREHSRKSGIAGPGALPE